MPLTPQQDHFCREYVAQRFNATAAYRLAYPKSKPGAAQTSASRLLSNAMVTERIAELAQQAAAAEGITPERVIRELGFVAFQRAGAIYREDGTLKAPCEWDEATQATIAGVETEEEFAAEGEEQEPQPRGGTLKRTRGGVTVTRTHKVKRWDKVRALELFMKHFGLLTEDAPHPDRPTFNLAVLSDAQKRQLLVTLRLARAAGSAAGGHPLPPGGA